MKRKELVHPTTHHSLEENQPVQGLLKDEAVQDSTSMLVQKVKALLQ